LLAIGRGNLILQPLQLLGDLDGQHVDARAEELPQLDHHPAHLDRQAAELAGDVAQPLRSAADHPLPSHGHAAHHQVPPYDIGDDPREEAQNAPVAQLVDVALLVPHGAILAAGGIRCTFRGVSHVLGT